MSFPIHPPVPPAPPLPQPGPGLRPLNQPGWYSTGGGLHDTFQVSPKGDILSGHTTVRLPGGAAAHLPWR